MLRHWTAAPIDLTLGYSKDGATIDGAALRLSGRNRAAHGIDGALRWAIETRINAPGGTIAGRDGRMTVRGQGSSRC